MQRSEIVKRVNQKMYEGLYSYDDMKDELDDAIIVINNTLNSKYPLISEKLTQETSEYTYTDEETGQERLVFPERYMRSVVIEFAVSELFRREGEFGDEYSAARTAHDRGLSAMFNNLYDKVPDVFIDDETGIIPVNPYEVVDEEINPYTVDDDDEW